MSGFDIDVEETPTLGVFRVIVAHAEMSRLRNIGACAGIDVRAVLERLLQDGVGFAVELLNAKHPDLLQAIRKVEDNQSGPT